MKNSVLFFLIFCSQIIYSQNPKAIELQNEWFEKAVSSLDSAKIKTAFLKFSFANELLPESNLGNNAKLKSDSLQIVLRDNLIKNLQGIWEIKIFNKTNSKEQKEHYEKLGKYLEFRNDSIYFYANKPSLKLKKPRIKQEIIFCDLKTTFPHYSDIIHSNGEIWNYSIDSSENKLIITENGELSTNGKSRSWNVSHPSGYTYNRVK